MCRVSCFAGPECPACRTITKSLKNGREVIEGQWKRGVKGKSQCEASYGFDPGPSLGTISERNKLEQFGKATAPPLMSVDNVMVRWWVKR